MWLKSIERMSYLVGALLLCAYAGAQLWIAQDAKSAVREFRRADVHGQVLRFGPPNTGNWAASRVSAHRSALGGALPRAVLLIPAIGLEVPVYDGATELNLNRGAARIDGTGPFSGEGNLGLAAHRDGYFRALQKVRKGDRIVMLTQRGRLQYWVTNISVVEPDAIEVLDPTDQPTLTLVTCYPFRNVGPAPRRFIVRAEALAQTPRSSLRLLHAAERPADIRRPRD